MKAHVYFNYARMGYEIFLYEERGSDRISYSFEDGYLGRRTIDPPVAYGEEMKPTMFLDGHVYDALRSAMIGDVLDNDNAYEDMKRVRDRLLVMIESEWQSRQLEKK